MKVEIEIEANGKHKNNGQKEESGEDLSDDQKMAIGKKLKKNMMLTRMERKLLSEYLLEEED